MVVITIMLRRLARVALPLLCLLVLPPAVYAHERWFVPNAQAYPPHWGLLTSPPVLLSVGAALLAVGFLALLRRVVGGDNRFPHIGFLRYYDRSCHLIIAIQTAISLIAAAITMHIFVPNLSPGLSPFGFFLVAIQLAIAFSFIGGSLSRVGAMTLVVTFCLLFFLFPFWAVLEQTLFLGIALYILILGRDPSRQGEPLAFFRRYWRLAPVFLRVGVGFSIMWLAFTEKLLNPQLALAFLREYPNFNVAHLLGMNWFTNEYFISASGAVELIIGVTLMSGILPRVVIFGLLVPFNLTLPFLPATELLGHLPVFASTYVLLFFPPPEVLKELFEPASSESKIGISPVFTSTPFPTTPAPGERQLSSSLLKAYGPQPKPITPHLSLPTTAKVDTVSTVHSKPITPHLSLPTAAKVTRVLPEYQAPISYQSPVSLFGYSHHIVIIGGGFAGVTTAQELEKLFKNDGSVAITLISDTNALLFTPMLSDVASGSLKAEHISTPLRSLLQRTTIIRGTAVEIDVQQRFVLLERDARTTQQRKIPYDHLVLALGSVSNALGNRQIEENSLPFKTLSDAILIRNQVIESLELADRERDPLLRQSLLTFVVAGGGFAGVELVGALNDFIHGLLRYYPKIAKQEINVVLIHARERVLPELSAELASYAQQRMQARGIIFKLGTRVVGAEQGRVQLSSREEIHCETFIWTAGTAPHPLLQTLPVARNKRGAVIVADKLVVRGYPGLWALGDCAAVPNPYTNNGDYPPTAQCALRQAKTLAANIHALINKRQLQSFRFKELGALCVIGRLNACAEIKGFRFSGLLAWLMWRAIYLMKLPGRERKVRVLGNWLMAAIFPQDGVQTLSSTRRRSTDERAAAADRTLRSKSV